MFRVWIAVSCTLVSSANARVEVGVGGSPSGTETRVRFREGAVHGALAWPADDRARGTLHVDIGSGSFVVGGVGVVSMAGWRTDEELRATTFVGDRSGSITRPSLRRDGLNGAVGRWRAGSLELGAGAIDKGARLGWVGFARRSWSVEGISSGREHLAAVRGEAAGRRVTLGVRIHPGGVDGRVVARQRFRGGNIIATWTSARDGGEPPPHFLRARTGTSVRIRAGPLELRHAWSVGTADTSRTTGIRARARARGVVVNLRLDRSRLGARPRTVAAGRIGGTVHDGWSASWSVRVERTSSRTGWVSNAKFSRAFSSHMRFVWSLHRASRGGAWAAFGGGPRGVERAWVAADSALLTVRMVWSGFDVVWASRTGDDPIGWWGVRWRR